MSGPGLASLLEFAVELAERAGRLALRYYRTEVEVERKADDSPVTAADREIERLLRAEVERRFPGDGIIGEEYGMTRAAARRVWMFDPIDGTRTFVRGVPFFGTMIALVEAGEPLLGVIHLPALGETVCAARGEGCHSNGARARVSAVRDLDRALVVTTDSEMLSRGPWAAGWDRVRRHAGLCRTWGDCYGYALVATGRAEAMIDSALNVWDAAAIFPIIEEAGGVVTDLEGLRRHDGGHLIATNAALSKTLRGFLRGGNPPA